MTPGQIIETALIRAGIPSPTATQEARARFYLNTIKTDVENVTDWRFLYKIGTLTTVAAQRAYELASGATYPLNVWDVTNDNPMSIRHPEDIDELDPDQDYDGNARIMVVTGTDATTGVWEVDLFPTPADSGDTIKYRYYATRADFTTNDDDTDLAATYPKFIENALLWGTCALYKEEKEQTTASFEWDKYGVALKAALKVNGKNDAPPRIVMGRSEYAGNFTFTMDVPYT